MRGQQDFVEKQNKTIVEREKTMQIIYSTVLVER